MKSVASLVLLFVTTTLFDLRAENLRSPLLDSLAIDKSFTNMVETTDLILRNSDIRKYEPNPKYKRYKAIFRTTFMVDEGNQPMTIEIAQKFSNDYDIIHKITTGAYKKVKDFCYPIGDGVKFVYTDSISECTKKQLDTLFAYLRNFIPDTISQIGTCTHRIEFVDIMLDYYFENTLFCSYDYKNYPKIIGILKKITKEIASSKNFDIDLFRTWVGEH